ncbi:hypothetical protein [Bradyrhizobium cenepequi]|uniref:hypothetical protein n=1 Tax=Bradyrhizobium cenepequi TaxID=2821403 RepID=UPI001CE36F5C|nr:hypothetical protein [Bradyrhizobium cenepequi]MCA6108265.1 hypothetical protein [Bradyrhizobium cenepequi]
MSHESGQINHQVAEINTAFERCELEHTHWNFELTADWRLDLKTMFRVSERARRSP